MVKWTTNLRQTHDSVIVRSNITITAIEKYSKDFEKCSGNIKDDMDKKFGAPWNCVVGEFFGFEITHEVRWPATAYVQFPHFSA